MAASDPATHVATPTGALLGVAAFSWDGSVWQPAGRASPDVATSTGALQGVAPFTWDGSAWQPSGRAGPGVATPTGVLNGAAVYTWSGSAWTPAGAQYAPSTPSGALRGIAAFSWDGSAWQPAAQAGPSVATPYGVLTGVAMFNWNGTAWQPGAALPSGATLDLSFLTPGTLDPRITFTRASTGTYLDATGTMRTAAINAPRWDYDPVTHALRGLLIEEARTNLMLNSGNAAAATWTTGGITAAAPTVTGNLVAAPDGTTTGARAVYPAVSGAGNASYVIVNGSATGMSAAPYAFSVWLRGNAGGEQLYLSCTADGVTYFRQAVTLTTAWQRFTLVTGNLTTVGWLFLIGTDRRDASQAATLAQTIYVWGAQVELGAFPTSYIPTTAASVTRAQDLNSMPTSPWMIPGLGSWFAEFVLFGIPSNIAIAGATTTGGQDPLVMISPANQLASYDGSVVQTSNTVTPGAVSKGASAFAISTGRVCLNGGAVASGAQSGFNFTPIGFIEAVPGASTNNGSGYMRRFRYWPRALTNAELQQVTT